MAEWTLPPRVKVAGWIYRIDSFSQNQSDNDNRLGHHHGTRQIIQVDTNFGVKVAAATLLHEILHAILYRFSWQPGDPQERIVECIEEGLVAVLLDNPDLMEWIRAGLLEELCDSSE